MMRIGVLILLTVCFLAGCVKSKPAAPEMVIEKMPTAGPPVKKFCVVGPGFENRNCLQGVSGQSPGR